jgi:hypothetical protein
MERTERLSPEAFSKAARFIAERARPLDQALFAFWFAGGAPDAVVAELRRFQNDDGGFGHGIEPDFLLGDSSALATTVALQYAGFLHLPAEHPLIRDAVRYFLGALEPKSLRWPAVPESVNDAAHAPWWHVDPKTGRCPVEGKGTWANPNAEIVGYLWRYRVWVPTIFLNRLTEKALQELQSAPSRFELHDFLCWDRLAGSLAHEARDEVQDRLRRSLFLTVETSPEAWASYGAEPLVLAPSPDALVAGELSALITQNLDLRIRTQGAEGGWWPNWEWGQYPEDWEKARRAWAGAITVRTLKTLRDYGRLSQED